MRVLSPLCTGTRVTLLGILCPAALVLGASPAIAQLPEGMNSPNEEPSSYDTLMDRTDMGNVAQAARAQLGTGVRELQKAERVLQKAAETDDPAKKAKLEEKAQVLYTSADKAFREAISLDNDLMAAYAGLGAALRGQGKSEAALQVHALALRQSPADMDNFQGWSESLLALDMLGNATNAYSQYVQTNPERAAILMTEIKKWLAVKQSEPGELDPAAVAKLADWIAQQEQG